MTRPAIKDALAGRHIEAVVIGASAGGVAALLRILPGLPAGYARPVVAVLHIPERRHSQLAEVFAHHMEMPVHEAGDKEALSDGTLYFAGSGYHLSIERDRTFSLSCEPPLHFARPAIDFLMESAADAYGERLAGILLTGANQDGAAGLAAIGAAGGLTIVQDPAEAQVPVMPQEAIRLRAPDLILPLWDIHRLLLKLEKN
ncbi:chemotaxis protein CheB [Oxalobacteraceae bacterium]|nr:chemotaxis protein CheB [Oxalobacteraceae bacterium]